MNVAVRYYSRGGNTKKIADAIAGAAGTEAKEYSEPLPQTVDLLFLGGSVYGFGLAEETKNYIAELNASQVKAVALFGTSAIVKSGNDEMAKLLKEKRIKVLDDKFHSYGSFGALRSGRPNEKDIKSAAAFAAGVIEATQE